MEWADWEPTDRALRADFGYTVEGDGAAARDLKTLLAAGTRPASALWRDLATAVRNRRNLLVLGCGPGLEKVHASHLMGRAVVACDGATARLRELGTPPSVVVTDLDGSPDGLRWAAAAGAHMVVHAHGDNRDALARLVPGFGPLVHGTHAVEPQPGLEPLRNFGGFTDGDRAVLLLEHMGARHATLVGFEFGEPPSRYSHKWDPATKARKMAWAKRIVEGTLARGKLGLAYWSP